MEVTALLHRWRDGDRSALDELVPLLYGELHRLAESAIRGERASHTLQATVLVNEAYRRMASSAPAGVNDRKHFCGVAARIMRHVLVDHARAKMAEKRGSGMQVQLDEAIHASSALVKPSVLLDVNDALDRLQEIQPELTRVLDMRFFGGLTANEIAEVTERSVATVNRDMRLALAWLKKELER